MVPLLAKSCVARVTRPNASRARLVWICILKMLWFLVYNGLVDVVSLDNERSFLSLNTFQECLLISSKALEVTAPNYHISTFIKANY